MFKRSLNQYNESPRNDKIDYFDISEYLASDAKYQAYEQDKSEKMKNEYKDGSLQFLEDVDDNKNSDENEIQSKSEKPELKQLNNEAQIGSLSQINQSDTLNDKIDSEVIGEKKGKLYAKNYRQKKKEQIKSLQEENRYLKSKVEDLSFRLKEAQIQLNKIKHQHTTKQYLTPYQSTRQQIIKQIEKVLEAQYPNIGPDTFSGIVSDPMTGITQSQVIQPLPPLEQLLKVQNDLKKLDAFNSKHKMDLLNYFMSELLQNLINDFGLYFVECLIAEGNASSKDLKLKRIDRDFENMLGKEDFVQMKRWITEMPEYVKDQLRGFKRMWKKLYEDYISIINQGILIQRLCQPLIEQSRKQDCHKQVVTYLKLQLYFQKIKYRKDMRQLRQTWFRQQDEEQQRRRNTKRKNN